MEKLKEGCRNLKRFLFGTSFSQSLFFYCVMGILGAAAANSFLCYLCNSWMGVIMRRYTSLEWLEEGVKWTDLSWIDFPEKYRIYLLLFVRSFGMYVLFLGAMLLVIRIYHRQRIIPVLDAVTELVENVKKGEYYRTVSYHGEDELGSICAQADELRRLLAAEKGRQQEAGEQQRRINAAFAHDIRTPLTVIKGYTEFLEKYLPQGKLTQEQVLEKLSAMRGQEERLLAFSSTMTAVQNLEKRRVCRQRLVMKEWLEGLGRYLEGLERGTGLNLELKHVNDPGVVLCDPDVMMEALENIWSNALRYARCKVVTHVKREGGFLTFYVKDDGPGFSDRALLRASEAYFREGEMGEGHFGLGLTISGTLCGLHGGGLTVVNSVDGGAIVTASFGIV